MRMVLLASALLLLLSLPMASAYVEADAPVLRSDVRGTWHDPAEPLPHTQWKGYLQLQAGTNVTAVHYQVCRVGDACFAPPTSATKAVGKDITYSFDTTGYMANGKPVDYQPGWHLGVKWLLTEHPKDGPERSVEFPQGMDLSSAQCQGDAAQDCAESHYFVLDIAGGADHKSPSPGTGPLVLALVLGSALFASRRRA